MANEATIRVSLQIRKSNLNYQSNPTSFQATVTGTNGPTPGSLIIPTTGRNVDFSELTTPGLCWLHNLSTLYYVEYGIYDPQSQAFYPIAELLPGECYPLRLTRNLREQYVDTGTGTSGPENYFHMRAHGGECVVRVEAFEQ